MFAIVVPGFSSLFDDDDVDDDSADDKNGDDDDEVNRESTTSVEIRDDIVIALFCQLPRIGDRYAPKVVSFGCLLMNSRSAVGSS